MKKRLFIILPIVLLLVGGGYLAYQKLAVKPEPEVEEEEEKNRITDPVNVIPVSDRPYMQIVPNRAHYVTIAINDLKKEADNVDYELEYQSGTLLQGAFGQIDLEQTPKEEEIMLGSCSAGGACTFHEDVKGGTLLTKFSGGAESYALKTDWRYFENEGELNEVSSRDAKFQLSAEGLDAANYVVVFNSPGAPAGLDREIISDIYTLKSSTEVTGSGQLLLRAEEEVSDAVILGYDGQEWVEFSTQVDGKELSAEVELLPLYLAVK